MIQNSGNHPPDSGRCISTSSRVEPDGLLRFPDNRISLSYKRLWLRDIYPLDNKANQSHWTPYAKAGFRGNAGARPCTAQWLRHCSLAGQKHALVRTRHHQCIAKPDIRSASGLGSESYPHNRVAILSQKLAGKANNRPNWGQP